MSVDRNSVAFPQAQVARHALHFLPDLAVVQVQNHLVRQSLYADQVRDEVFRVVRRRRASGGRRACAHGCVWRTRRRGVGTRRRRWRDGFRCGLWRRRLRR